MGVFGWLKKATKVVGKMAMDAAEEPQVQEDKTSVRRGQVANPTHDPYLEKWNNRAAPQIINLEMPELTFETRYDFSKVRAYDFGMENNPIVIFIDGENQLVAKEDILCMNRFLSEGHLNDSEIPVFSICEKEIRFVPSDLQGADDYTRLAIMPLTPTGKRPKNPLMMAFCLLSQDEQWKISQAKGKEVFGRIYYLPDGNIGKAEIICWIHNGTKSSYFVFQIRRGNDGLFLSKVVKHLNCFQENK